jgi:hypothetical protein
MDIKLDNLNEKAIEAWWDSYKKTNPKFRGLSNNCSTIISHALDVGGARKHVPSYGIGLLYWDPSAVLEYGRELQQAGSGVYVPPPEPHWVK